MTATAVSRLRDTLAERFPDAQPLVYRTAGAAATGVVDLDRLLPGGGLPRGQLTVWRPGCGATAILRAACMATVERGERAVWVDTAGQVLGDRWPRGPLLVRPTGPEEALECAEELARSGGFGIVVLGPGRMELPVRLGRAAREGGGALVAMNGDTAHARLRIDSRLAADSWRWGRDPFGDPTDIESALIEVSAASLGWSGHTCFRLPVLSHEVRLALDPLLVDRRGAPRRATWPAGRSSRPEITSSNTSCKSRKNLQNIYMKSSSNVRSRPFERAS